MDSRRPRVLLVEDDQSLRELLEQVLAGGYDVRALPDANDLPSHLAAFEPDAVLLDVMLPGVSGLEAARQSRPWLEPRNVPVLFLTALSDERTFLEGLRSGDGYLTKPVAMSVLLDRIAILLKEREI